jgi:hypothetical protein
MTMYEVINLETLESHGEYRSLDEARGCVEFDRLVAYAIWHGDERVECFELAYDEAEFEERERMLDAWAWARENHEDGVDGDSRCGAGW